MFNVKTPKQKAYLIFCAVFIAIELGIHATFTTFNLTQKDPSIVQFVGILLCFAAAAVQFYFFGHDGAILLISSLITCVADLFLVILVINDIGVFVFIFAQITYFTRIYLVKNKFPTVSLILRLTIFAVIAIALTSTQSFNFLTATTAFYFVNLFINAIESVTLIKYEKRFILFTVGLILFIGCDVCVGLTNFSSVLGIDLPKGLLDFASFAIWQFYLPSQVLIILSANQKKFKSFSKEKSL